MGVYSIRNNDIDLNTGIQECVYEPGIEAAWGIVAESEANYNAIMQAIGIEELMVYESTGEEMVYEASQVSGFFGKMKEFFMKIWEKIKGLFKKFFAMFDSYTKSDKDFINKYKNHLLKVDTRNFEYKGFNFTETDLSLSGVDSKVKTEMEKYVGAGYKDVYLKLDQYLKAAEDKVDIVEKMRGAAIGESSLTAAEFTKELFKMFRSGEESKETLDTINVSDLLMNISANSKLKKEAEKAYKELEKSLKDEIKDIEKYEKEMTKAMPEAGDVRAKQIRHANNYMYFKKEKMNILQVVNGAKLTAIKDLNRQSKAICVALMNYKPKNESFGFEDDYASLNEGFLSGVVLR